MVHTQHGITNDGALAVRDPDDAIRQHLQLAREFRGAHLRGDRATGHREQVVDPWFPGIPRRSAQSRWKLVEGDDRAPRERHIRALHGATGANHGQVEESRARRSQSLRGSSAWSRRGAVGACAAPVL